MNILHYLSPSTAPPWVVAIVALFLVYLLFRLVRMIVRAYRHLSKAYDDAPHLQVMARHHAKLHEGDGRGWN